MIYSNDWLSNNNPQIIKNKNADQTQVSVNSDNKPEQISKKIKNLAFGGHDLDDNGSYKEESLQSFNDLISSIGTKIAKKELNLLIASIAKQKLLSYDPTGPIPFPKSESNLELSFDLTTSALLSKESSSEHDSIDKVIRIEPEACIDLSIGVPYTNAFRYLYDILGATFADYPLEKLTGQLIVHPSLLLSIYQDLEYNPNENSISIEQTKSFLLSKEIDPFMICDLSIVLERDGLTDQPVCTINMTRFKNESNLFTQ